ncbi:hypothetical protein Tco_1570073 [Tanacetum coccineum]
MKETPYELPDDDQKKKLGKNNEAKMTLYNTLPRKEYEKVFMSKVTKEKTSDDSDSQGGTNEDVDEEEEAEPKENKAFVVGAWNDSEDGDEHQNDTTCLMENDSQEVVSKPSSSNYDLNIIDLQKENEELLRFNKDITKTFEKLLKEKRSLKNEIFKLSSKINDLEIKVKKLSNDKEVVESCKKFEVLTKAVNSLK